MPLPTRHDLLWDSGQPATSLSSFSSSMKWGDGCMYALLAGCEHQRNELYEGIRTFTVILLNV